MVWIRTNRARSGLISSSLTTLIMADFWKRKRLVQICNCHTKRASWRVVSTSSHPVDTNLNVNTKPSVYYNISVPGSRIGYRASGIVVAVSSLNCLGRFNFNKATPRRRRLQDPLSDKQPWRRARACLVDGRWSSRRVHRLPPTTFLALLVSIDPCKIS